MSEKSRKVFVWDMDGVVLDSAKETHVLTVEALKRHKAKVERAFGSVKSYSYSQFYADRPYVKHAHEYFVHGVMRSTHGKGAAKISAGERAEFYKKNQALFDELVKEFYAIRKELQKDPKKWNNLSPVYKGIPEAMRALKDAGYEFAVVSTKDKATILSSLKHNGLLSLFKPEHVFDQTTGKTRAAQVQHLFKAFGKSEYIIIDDLPDSHAQSKPAFEAAGHKVTYVGAKWGLSLIHI